jgi:hypothetical protein
VVTELNSGRDKTHGHECFDYLLSTTGVIGDTVFLTPQERQLAMKLGKKRYDDAVANKSKDVNKDDGSECSRLFAHVKGVIGEIAYAKMFCAGLYTFTTLANGKLPDFPNVQVKTHTESDRLQVYLYLTQQQTDSPYVTVLFWLHGNEATFAGWLKPRDGSKCWDWDQDKLDAARIRIKKQDIPKMGFPVSFLRRTDEFSAYMKDFVPNVRTST